MADVKEKWDSRFNVPEFMYGKEPNDFLKSIASQLRPQSRILSLGEGEGRNAVFLAKLGHDVTAVDISSVGLKKAQQLAAEAAVKITTLVADITQFPIELSSWDVIVSMWLHLPSVQRQELYKKSVVPGLVSGGFFILEAYTPEQLRYGTGGPSEVDLCVTLKELKTDLVGLEIIQGKEIIRSVNEGQLHNGTSAVVQLLGKKY